MKSKSLVSIQKMSLEIKKNYDQINYYDGHKKWQVADYTMGMIGDCGDLCKLVMAKNKLRRSKNENLDQDIEHELVDILWSLVVIADELNIDLENAATVQLDKLKQGVTKVLANTQKKL
jgi:NTP pyrophosphatase (non-canonical NTP hydrolase)